MANEVLAEAVVELEADTDKFNREFKRSLKQAEKDAKDSTDEIDKSFKQLTGDLGKEFERASKEFARQQREQEREAKRVQREIERENLRVQREIEVEAKRVQREIERETARVARENEKAQKEFEKEFIAAQRAMEKEAENSSERNATHFKNFASSVKKLASERFSLTLGIDSSQLAGAVATASKLGAVLGALGVGALAGQAVVPVVAQLALALQDLVGSIALLPAVGASAGIVIGTLTLGLRGLGDAITADKPEKLNKALKALSKNGQKFALAVRDLKDEFDDFTKGIQDNLLAGFDEEVTRLGKVLLPLLSRNFNKIATELRDMGITLGAFIRQADTLKDVERLFTNTQKSLFVFRRSLVPLVQAFKDIAVAGSDFLPIIAADIGGATRRFADFIAEARKSGQLGTFFQSAVQAVRDFFGVLGNLGGIFNSVMTAARAQLGGSFLTSLREATAELNTFLKSFEGQNLLQNFFKNAHDAAKLVLPIVGDVVQLVVEDLLPAFVKLGTVAAPPIHFLLDGLRKGIQLATPGLVSFVDSLGAVVTSLVDAGVLDALGELVNVLGTSLGAALRSIAPKLGDLLVSVLTKLADILPKILPALAKFATAFGDLVIAALPLVDILAGIVSKVGLPTLQRIAEALTPIMDRLARTLGETLLPILPELADAISEWVDAMAPLVDESLAVLLDLVKALVPLLPSLVRSSTELAKAALPIVKVFADIADAVSKFLTKLYEIPGVKKFMDEQLPGILALITGTLIVPLGKLLELIDKVVTKLDDVGFFDIFIQNLTALANALGQAGNAFELLKNIVETVFTFIPTITQQGIEFLAGVIVSGIEGIKNYFITTWNNIKAFFGTVIDFLKSIGKDGADFLLSIFQEKFNALPEVVQGALRRLRDVVLDGLNQVLNYFRDIPGRIKDALGISLGNLLFDAGQDVVRGFINGIKSLIGVAANESAAMAKAASVAARAELNSKSPSRVMMDVGHDFGQGFVVGIQDMLRRATEAGTQLAAQTTQASRSSLTSGDNSTYRLNETLNRLTRNGLGPAPTALAPATDAGAQQPVTVTPEVHVYIGNKEIDNHITEVVNERDRRTKRSLTMGAGRLV